MGAVSLSPKNARHVGVSDRYSCWHGDVLTARPIKINPDVAAPKAAGSARDWAKPGTTGPNATPNAAASRHSRCIGPGLAQHQAAQRVEFGNGLELAMHSYDVLVSNPPYIPHAEMAALAPEVQHEDYL